MRPDRRIDAAPAAGLVHDDAVQALAHAVQALELERRVARHVQDRGDGVGVVGRELRIDAVGLADQLAGVGDVAHVGRGLDREQRKARMTLDLGALHFGVPVGALDQPHHDPPVQPRRGLVKPVDRLARALAIGLHHHPEPVPAGERGVRQHSLDHLERDHQPVLFLGVDVHAHVRGRGLLREPQHHRHQVAHDPRLLRDLVARVQRRQLDRDAGVPFDRSLAAGAGDRRDGVGIGAGVARRVRRRHRRLAQHVVAVGVALLFQHPGAVQRVADGLAQYELAPHLLHRPTDCGADHRLAQPSDQSAQRSGVIVVQDLAGQHQRPGRGVDEAGRRLAQVTAPVRGGDLVLDQRVDGGAVGHAQHRLGQAHQRHPLAGGQAVFGQEMFHQRRARLGPDAAHQIGSPRADVRAGGGRQRRPGGQAFQQPRLVRELGLCGKHAGRDRGHADLLD